MNNPVAKNLVDSLIEEGTRDTTSGNYIFYFDEIKKDYQVDLRKDKKLLRDMVVFARLYRDEIVSDLVVEEDCLDFDFYLDYCPNVEEMEMDS